MIRFRPVAVTLAALLASTALAGCATDPPATVTSAAEASTSALKPCAATETPYKPAATGDLSIAPLQFTCKQLANGLRIYAMPDTDTASVSVAVWYDVGSKDDPKGRSGFAHLFEHIMFKSTSNLPAEGFDRLTEDAGGFNNASTWNDFTNYYETVPANHLERVLWGEAERMGSLVVDEAAFGSERDVVKEEFRQSVLSQPYGKLFYLYLNQASFDVHPYGRPGIGSIEDLDAATVEDVRAFHAAYYRPDNAVMVVSGNFAEAQLDAYVEKYFAGIATPTRPIPRVTAVEPVRTAPKSFTVYEPNVPLPAVALSWPSPDAQSKDNAALIMMNAVLTSGQSSRLYQSLVYDQQLVTDVGSNFEVNAHPGVFSLYAILSEGKAADEGLAGLNAEVKRMRDTLVTQAELDEARNEIITGTIEGRETSDGRADELARAIILFKDAQSSDKLLAQLQTVTPQDIQRVARAIMDDAKSVTIKYLPEGMQNGAPKHTFADAPTIQTTTVSIPASEIPIYTLAAEGARQQPPEPGPAVAARVPTAVERTLPNGLRVVVASKPGLPLISASLRISAGGSLDPATKAGLAAMTADLTTRGTATRTATEIASQIESLGAAIGASAGPDASDVSITTRSDQAAKAFAIMADVVQNPAFAADELDRAKQETLDGLMVSMRQPGAVGSRAMTRALYGAAPYGNVTTPATVTAITAGDMAAFHKANWKPDSSVLVIAGDVTSEQGFALAESAFGRWAPPAGASNKSAVAAPMSLPVPRALVVDIPQAGQAAVLLGRVGPSRQSPDYVQTTVANAVLGVGYSSRLNSEIRIKRGLSYGAGASLAARKGPAPIIGSAQTRNDAVPQVIDLLQSEFTRLGNEPIANKELAARKAFVIGGFGRSVETTSGLAGQYSALAQFGLQLTRLQTYSAEISAVTGAQAGEAARKYYDPSQATLVIVGDAAKFWDDVKDKRGGMERITVDDLDFDSPTLK
jgi:zinc protease